MLTHLQIRDFAIIDAVELEFAPRPDGAHRRGPGGGQIDPGGTPLQLLAGGPRRAPRWCATWRRGRAEVSGTFELG